MNKLEQFKFNGEVPRDQYQQRIPQLERHEQQQQELDEQPRGCCSGEKQHGLLHQQQLQREHEQ